MSTQEFLSNDEMYEALVDIKLRIAVTELAMEEANRIMEEMDADPELGRLSQEGYQRSEEQFNRMLASHFRKKRLAYIARHILPRVGIAAAATLLAFYIGLSTAIAVSSTVRVRVMDMIVNIERQYTELSLEENPEASFDVPAEWMARYYPTYIPEGYELVEVFGAGGSSIAEFRNGEGKRLIFSERDESGMTNIDTENADIGQRIISGKQVMTVEKNGIATLVWSEQDRYYILWMDGGLDVAIQIMEGLSRIN